MNGKRFFATVSGLVLVLAMGSPVLAASSEKAEPSHKVVKVATKAKKQAPRLHTFTGEVASVDQTANTVTVKSKTRKGKELTLGAKVNDKTVIKSGKATKTLADLKAGDKVSVKYRRTAEGDVASSILIRSMSK